MSFRKIKVTLLALVYAGLLAGCETIGGWFEEDEYDPTAPVELTDIYESVKLSRQWSTSVGDGQGDGLYKITPVLDDGILYTASADGEVAAIDADRGRRLGKSIWICPFPVVWANSEILCSSVALMAW